MQKERHIRCIQWLRPSNVRESHQCNIAARVSTTCEWVLEHSVFKAWLDANGTETTGRVMIVQGPAGCGKSVLGSFIFEMLEQRPLITQETTAIFSFSIGDANRKSSDSMVRTLLSQLFEQDRDGKLLPFFEELMSKGPPSNSEIFKTLEDAIQILSCPVRCVIDGFDESSDSVADMYSRLMEIARGHSNFHVVLLGRPQAFARDSQSVETIPTIYITPEINHDDMQTFISAEALRCTKLSSSLRSTVAETLLKKADGMFLWVKLMLDDLKRAATDDETIQRLDDLPHGLEEAYRHILHRLTTTLDKRQIKLVQILLTLAVTCGRPLEEEELRWAYAMVVKPASESNIELFLLRLPPDQIIDVCGGLLVFTGSVFNVVHGSIKEFLSRPVEYWAELESQQISNFQVPFGDSHATLSDACLNYLVEVDCSQLAWEEVTSLNDLQEAPPLLQYACFYSAYHMNRSELSADQMMDKIRKLLASDQCFFAVEYVLMIGITDSILQLQGEVIELSGLIFTLCSASNGTTGLLDMFVTRWEQEYVARVSKYGESDARTQRCIALRDPLVFLQSFITRGFPESSPLIETGNESSESGGNTEGQLTPPAVSASQPSKNSTMGESLRAKQSHGFANIRPLAVEGTRLDLARLKDLLRTTHDISLGHQFQLFARIIHQMATLPKLIDPLKALWQYIKRKAASMPVLLLVAAAGYYFEFDKYEESLELCNICLGRLTDRDVILNVFVNCFAARLHIILKSHDKAIQHVLAALPTLDQLFGPSHMVPRNWRLSFADCYYYTDKYEHALQILDGMLQDGLGTTKFGGVSGRSSLMANSAEEAIHGNGFMIRTLERALRHSHETKKPLDAYDLGLKRQEIHAYLYRGNMNSRLFRPQEASLDWGKCLELGYQIPEASRSKYILETLFFAHYNTGIEHIGIRRKGKSRDKEALEAVRRCQELCKSSQVTISAYDEANFNRLCGYALNINAGMLGISVQSAKDAMQGSVASFCETRGAEICANEMYVWYDLVAERLTANRDAEDKASSMNIISIYRRFLDAYEGLHGKEPLKSLHSNSKLFVAYFGLAGLYYTAKRYLDAIEAYKGCLQICEDLWTPTPDAELFELYVLGWNNLSFSHRNIHRYLDSAKAARKSLNIAEDHPEMLQDSIVLIDPIRDNLVYVCDQLWSYGPMLDSACGDSSYEDPLADSKFEVTPAEALTNWIKERRKAMDIGDKAWDDYFPPHGRTDIGTLGTRWSDKEKYRSVEALLLLGHRPDLRDIDDSRPHPQ